MHYDVFNGDADGIIALIQLRLAKPQEAMLITGVKRDIALLKQVDSSKARSVTVLDISLEKNAQALNELLAAKVNVFYVDHHRTGDVPQNEYFTSLLNTDANTCTSLLVNEYLNGRYANWAIAAAFGDNMTQSAQQLAEQIKLTDEQTSLLAEFGVYINYNGYGRTVDDLHFHPAELFKKLVKFNDPLELITEKHSIFSQLKQAYLQDMKKAQDAIVLIETEVCKIVQLADEVWARRVSGVFCNKLANKFPNKAHAVLTLNNDKTYTVSVRAPLNNKQGADEICIQFPSGGGRAGAAGVNQLPQNLLEQFIQVMSNYYI